MSVIQDNLKRTMERIATVAQQAGREASDITLVAVSKFQPLTAIEQAAAFGQLDFGENYPQELWTKASALREPPVRWHMIGHLQRNKVNRVLPIATLIHSVDSVRLLDALETTSQKQDIVVPVLIEVNVSREPNKSGFAPEALQTLGKHLLTLRNVRVEGLMTMAAYDDNVARCGATFAELHKLSERLRHEWGLSLPHLSMGMSNDFEIAIKEGATIVRVGTAIFGARN
jgi:pyridoxal phosphate enzyme (YggS family)